MAEKTTGAVLVVGAGIAGVQASLDLADSGYLVYLVDKAPVIGGKMAQLDKTFPTNDCSMCILSPKLVEVGRHLNIELLTLTEVLAVEGEEGDFTVTVRQSPRYVDMDRCIACGACAEKCPRKVRDEFHEGVDLRKAIYLPYPQAVPLKYAIDADHCIYFEKGKCKACVKFCPTEAIRLDDTARDLELKVGAVIATPGFTAYDPAGGEHYQYETSPNVVTSLEFERLLSASGPTGGELKRISDGETPHKIAWLQCVGSRDIHEGAHSYCSSVCCMYANKQAVIAKEHSHDDLDAAVFFMDMRTYGKEFDAYQIRAEDESGVRFIRSRVHSVFPLPDDRLRIVYASESGSTMEEIFDLVVLSVGFSPCAGARELAASLGIELNEHGFAATADLAPVCASRPGIYACGTFQEPKDIPAAVMEASAAAAGASAKLSGQRWQLTRARTLPPERDIAGEEPRIGVFVCNCGINIGGVADVPAVRDYAATLPQVVHVEDKLFACSQDSLDQIKAIIEEKQLNRVVVASCSPRTHEPLFQETILDAGLNKYLFEMANIRDQNTWVHMNDPARATTKARELVRMAVAKAARTEPLHQVALDITRSVLIVGGGVAGLEAALGVAEQGYQAVLVEKSGQLGGVARDLRATWQGEDISRYLAGLVDRVTGSDRVTVLLNSQVTGSAGSYGNFVTTVAGSGKPEKTITVEHGATIIATGGQEDKPDLYLYGRHPDVLTHLDMDRALAGKDDRLTAARSVVFIQCVGSRDENHPYCSKTCCTHSLKSALEVKQRNPRARVFILYRDIRAYGFRESLYKKAREKGIIFIRFEPEQPPQAALHRDKQLVVTVTDHVLRRPVRISPDLLVLATGIIPAANKDLFEIFKVPVNNDGFLVEAHAKLRPVDFASDGLFVAGLAHYPKPLEETIAQARAAVSRAMTIISRDALLVGGVVAEVDPERCAVCLTCVRTCSYGVPFIHEDGYAVIEAAECHGCGSCVAECPGQAITLRHFTDEQILAKTHALFAET